DNGGFTNVFYEYDPNDNSNGPDGNGGWMGKWTLKAPFGGGPRYGAVGFSIEGNDLNPVHRGYIACGNNGSIKKDVWEYNPDNDTWTRKDDYPGGGSQYQAAFGIINKGYIGMG